MKKMIDLTGQIFGRLTIIEYAGKKNKIIRWKCKCICGNIKIISGKNLKSGQTKSCGCLHKEIKINLVGEKFGRLVVIKYAGKNKHNHLLWECKCECGKIKNICGNSLKSNLTESCGCFKLERIISSHRVQKGMSGFNLLFRTYERSAKKRNLEFNLTKEEFSGLTKQNCYYCGIEPLGVSYRMDYNDSRWGEYIYNGIDRKDNNKGYIIENCVSCCKECNYFKGDRNNKEFIGHIKKIYEHIIGEGKLYDKLLCENGITDSYKKFK